MSDIENFKGIIAADWSKFIVAARKNLVSDKIVFKFPNGYGASVIRIFAPIGFSHDGFELAVLDANGKVTYETEITNDVIPGLTGDEVVEYLRQIMAL